MSFEWQTEEERDWEQPDLTGGGEHPRPRRRWPALLLLAVLIASGAYLAWQQVRERVDETTEVIRDEVRATHDLANRAALDRDQELFVSMLSGRSATWTEAQRNRLDEGLLFSETGRLFGFRVAEAAREPEVALNPDLTEAILSVAQAVAVDAGSGLTETVVFTQTHIFRQGSERWLLSPPDDEFWGSWETRDGQLLQLVYPQRDEELALRLADDLDRKLMEMCRTVVDCPGDFVMRLRLEKDPQSVLLAANGEERLGGGRELTLPSPTLVGLPVDEAAYAALFRGYAGHLVSAALVDLLDYTCCELVLFQEAFLDWQLSRLSLRSAPIGDEDFIYLIDEPLNLERLRELWTSFRRLAPDEEAPIEVHAFIDFLRQKMSMRRDPLMDMHRVLSNSSNFWSWLSFFTEYEAANPGVLQEDWFAYVWEKARAAQTLASPLPADLMPQQDVVALCGDEMMDVYRYSLATGEWTRELEAGYQFAVLAPLPDGDGYMVTGELPTQRQDTALASFMQRGDEPPFAISQQRDIHASMLPWDVQVPGSERMLVWLYGENGDTSWNPGVALIDPSTCAPDGCDVQRLVGLPVWSPVGSLVLALDIEDGRLLFRPSDSTEWETIAEQIVAWPFWLDDGLFGYIQPGADLASQTLTLVRAADGEVAFLISSGELSDSLPALRSTQLRMNWAGAHPFHAETILLLASSVDNDALTFLFSLSMSDGRTASLADAPTLTLLQTFEGDALEGWFGTNYSRADRYLVIPLLSPVASNVTGSLGAGIAIYDLADERIVLSSAAPGNREFLVGEGRWSEDARWFARSVGPAIDLVAPEMQNGGRVYRQLIFHDFTLCQSVAWVDP